MAVHCCLTLLTYRFRTLLPCLISYLTVDGAVCVLGYRLLVTAALSAANLPYLTVAVNGCRLLLPVPRAPSFHETTYYDVWFVHNCNSYDPLYSLFAGHPLRVWLVLMKESQRRKHLFSK